MRGRGAALVTLAVAALCAPAAASGAQVAVDQGCYAENVGTITITGSGYTPSSSASIALGAGTATASTDETGAFTTTMVAPASTLRHPGAQQLTLTATDDASGAAATTAVNLAKTGVDGVPATSKPHTRITWNIAGFPGTKPIYGHWRLHSRTRGDHRMGVPQGPCGVLHVRARQIEAKQVPLGTWFVQFDFNRHFDKHATPRASVQIKVARTFGRARA